MPSIESAASSAIELAVSMLAEGPQGSRVWKSDRDFADAADFAIEDAVRRLLAAKTPGIGFLGEERGRSGREDLYWCLDPIDGTANYTRSIPNHGISLALIEDGVPTGGIIALPAFGERYTVFDGDARLNGAKIATSDTTTLAASIVTFGDFASGTGSGLKNERRLAMLGALADRVARVRMLGSAATDLAWLASGRVDAVVIDANRTWDVAAGIALAEAAGAVVTHLDGRPYTLDGPDLLAATPQVHDLLISVVRS